MIRRPIDKIIIHCADTPNGRWTTAADIDSWHRERGFKRSGPKAAIFNPELTSIGYHYVIGTNGAIWTGRHMEEVGAHVATYNQRSIGICMAGRDAYSQEQWDSLRKIVMALPYAIWDMKPEPTFLSAMAKLRERGIDICGHRDVPKVTKTCPGFDVRAWVNSGGVPAPEHLFKG
jgi:N-acetylmuramoyl-L-alanine amidase